MAHPDKCPKCKHRWHVAGIGSLAGICVGCPCNYGAENELPDPREKGDRVMSLLERAAEAFSDCPPDSEWFRDYFLIKGDHMILDDEGWVPGDTLEQTRKDLDDPEWKPDDEVNAPVHAQTVGS